jgi:glycosyltransferase involved in cell wall biosynthesis
MQIDILMATYNGAKYINSQILSILAQSHTDWSLIIHDDGSQDDTIQIIKKFISSDARIVLIEDGIRFGNPGKNFMHLLQYSKADYVMYCDQDDIWFDNKLSRSFEKIYKRNNGIPQLVYSNSYVWIPNEGIKGLATLTFPKNINQFLFLNSGMQGCVAIFNRAMRDVLVSYNGRLAMHDHILHLSGLCLGEVEYMPECLMLYRNHSKNVTGGTITSSYDIRSMWGNYTIPVVDRRHYDAVSDFYEYFKTSIKPDIKPKLELYLNAPKLNPLLRLCTLFMSNFQLFNSRFRLVVKLVVRPYINN